MKKVILSLFGLAACLSADLVAEATPMKKYEAQNFDKLLGHVEGLNDDLLKMHFKLYQGYVTNTNLLIDKIQALNIDGKAPPPEFAGFKHMLGWEFDGMLLHELYFGNLGGAKQPLKQDDPLMRNMIADFGSYENWKNDFISTGAMRGIGWAILYREPNLGRLINVWINEHDLGHLAGGAPILVMDVFEHAYITQFGLDRAGYIKVFFDNIDWTVVSRRFKDAANIEGEGGVILKF